MTTIQIDEVPADYVRIPIRNEMEVALWLCPNGSKFVQLKDESEATWEAYCARLAKDNAAEREERKRFKSGWKGVDLIKDRNDNGIYLPKSL